MRQRLNPSLVLSLIALVMASAGTGYAALGDGSGAVSAGNSRGEPVEIQVRNRSRGETGLVTASEGYSLRLSNTQEGGGGGAVYGCRAPDAPPASDLACLYADNLRGGKAFLFRSRDGQSAGHFDLGNPAGAPFTTNATGLVANLNADKVDGLDASQLTGATGPQGRQGPAGPQGPVGVSNLTYVIETFSSTSIAAGGTTSLEAACPAGLRPVGGGVFGPGTGKWTVESSAINPVIETATAWAGRLRNDDSVARSASGGRVIAICARVDG